MTNQSPQSKVACDLLITEVDTLARKAKPYYRTGESVNCTLRVQVIDRNSIFLLVVVLGILLGELKDPQAYR